MNFISLMDLTAATASLAALLFILFASRNTTWKPEITLFAFIIILTVSHDAGNFLEWTGFTNWFDQVEDYLEILTAALWAFFLYTFLQELTERDLRSSEEKYRRLFETGNDAIFVFSINEDGITGLFDEVNDEAVRRYGYSREELLNMSPAGINSPDNAEDITKIMVQLVSSGHLVFERIHITKDGRNIPMEISSHLFDYHGVKRVISICRDITARKEAEKKLFEIQELDEKILDGSPVAFILRDANLRVVRVSRAFKNVTGYDPLEVVGKKTEEFMPDIPGREELEARHRKVLEIGVPVGPTEVKAPTPIPRFIRENIFPISNAEGEVTNTLSVLEDITAQVQAERKLREVQELDKKILDGSPVAFVLHDLDMRIIRVSSAYEKVTGFMSEDVLSRTLMEFMPAGPQKDGIIKRMENVMDQKVQVGPMDIQSPIENRHLRETILPVFDPDGRLVNTLTVLEDITEQKQARDALEESESRYRLLFDSIHDGVVVHRISDDGRPGIFLEVNHTFCQMTGYTREELLKMTPLDVSHPAEFKNVESIRSALAGGGSAAFERDVTTKAGSRLHCELKAHSFQMAEERVVLSVVRDITERKAAQDRISNSLAEKETLLREIHHRVKNNLQVISGLLNLQSHYIDDEGVRSIYKESQNRIKTMALIHEELYQRDDLARINLAEYIGELAKNLMASYSTSDGRIKLVLDLVEAEITIDTAIPCGLIVNEIVSNSLAHAFPENTRGKIEIKLRLLDGERYELTISDDGTGLPDGLNVKGTETLGLRLVSILADQLGSDLEMKNDDGATFRLVFEEYLEAGAEMY